MKNFPGLFYSWKKKLFESPFFEESLPEFPFEAFHLQQLKGCLFSWFLPNKSKNFTSFSKIFYFNFTIMSLHDFFYQIKTEAKTLISGAVEGFKNLFLYFFRNFFSTIINLKKIGFIFSFKGYSNYSRLLNSLKRIFNKIFKGPFNQKGSPKIKSTLFSI